MINHFWNRWVKEYLLELRNAHRYPNTQHQSQPAARVGDIVVIHDSDLPRGFWKIARITRLIIGKDGHPRGAILQVAERGEQATTLQRPLQALYPLEVHINSCEQDGEARSDEDHGISEHSSSPSSECTPNGHSDDGVQRGSRRQSALKARELCKKWSAELLGEDS